MCGRYFLLVSPERVQQVFGTENCIDFVARTDIAPLQTVPLIVRRRIGLARWGLLPSFAQGDDQGLCAKLKNARAETITEKPAFSDLWQKSRRCVVPASGFIEWPEKKVKGHPGFTVTAQEGIIAFAGLWAKHGDLITFTILTCQASPDLALIHSRMPVAFTPQKARDWLDADAQAARVMLNDACITSWLVEKRESRPFSEGLFAA